MNIKMDSLTYQQSADGNTQVIAYNGRNMITKCDKTYFFQTRDLRKDFLPQIEEWISSPPPKANIAFLKKCQFLISTLGGK